MTFSDNNILINLSSKPKDMAKGFKCTENHNSGKNRKFRYYCAECLKNICSECVFNHMHNFEKMHGLIVLDYQKISNYKYIEFINKNLKVKKDGNTSEISEINESFEENQNKIIKIIPVENIAITKVDNEEKFDYFTEFINIIINDYLDFPNYYHTYNIESIYRLFDDVHNFGIKIKYINQPNKIIRLFGSKFVKNNKNTLSIIFEDSNEIVIEYIKESRKFDKSKNIIEIYLTDKNKDYEKNYNYGFYNISHMFKGCDSIYEIKSDITGVDLLQI